MAKDVDHVFVTVTCGICERPDPWANITIWQRVGAQSKFRTAREPGAACEVLRRRAPRFHRALARSCNKCVVFLN
jgi:hypothetical protein